VGVKVAVAYDPNDPTSADLAEPWRQYSGPVLVTLIYLAALTTSSSSEAAAPRRDLQIEGGPELSQPHELGHGHAARAGPLGRPGRHELAAAGLGVEPAFVHDDPTP